MSQVPHIAVVDDEKPARDMVGDYLRMHGFSVALCDGGACLRAAIAQQTPDLIVLDLNMPEEDGLSIIRDLKQRTSVPIIMLTATASAIDRVVGLELGADDYLAKPCELRELLARIRSVLRRSAGAQQRRARECGQRPARSRAGHACASGRNGSIMTHRRCGMTKATSIRSRPRNMACSRFSPPIPSGCSPATDCWNWPTPGTPRPSIVPSTCASCAFAGRSNPTRPVPRSSAPCEGAATCFPRTGETSVLD